jgi:hypothetical protein
LAESALSLCCKHSFIIIFYFTLCADSTKQTSWAKDVKSQLEQLKQAVEKPITKPPEHAHIGNRNKRIPQFRSGVEIELAHIGTANKRIPQFRSGVETELAHSGNRKQEDSTVQVRCRN